MSWRFLAGIEEEGLRCGWSSLVLGHPCFRTIAGTATLSLSGPSDVPLVLQVHAGQLEFDKAPPRLILRVGDRTSEVAVGAGWNTFHVPLAPVSSPQTVKLELVSGVEWRGEMMVNEVSLLAEDSPLLVRYRRRLQLTTAQMDALTSVLPSPTVPLGPAPWHMPAGGAPLVHISARVRGSGVAHLLSGGERVTEAFLSGEWQVLRATLRDAPGIVTVEVEGEDVEVDKVEVVPDAWAGGTPGRGGDAGAAP